MGFERFINIAAAPKRPVKPSKPQALAGKKPAKFALEGNKWIIVSHTFILVSLGSHVACRNTKKTSLG